MENISHVRRPRPADQDATQRRVLRTRRQRLQLTVVLAAANIFLFRHELERLVAPPARFGCPVPGTVFTYDIIATNTGRPNRHVAVRDDDFTCFIWSDASGHYDWLGGLIPRREPLDPHYTSVLKEIWWPLRVGNRARWEGVTEDGMPMRMTFEVVGYGLERVPAGWFWAYKVVKTYETAVATNVHTLWWAPGVNWNIRNRTAVPRGPLPRQGLIWWDLIKFAAPSP